MKLSSLQLVLPLLVAVTHLVAAKPTGRANLEASYLPPSPSENEPRFIAPVDLPSRCPKSAQILYTTVSRTTNLYESLTKTQLLSVTKLVKLSKTVTSTRHKSVIQQAYLSHSIQQTETAYVTNTKYITKPHVVPVVSMTDTEQITFTMTYTSMIYNTVTTTLQETALKTKYDHVRIYVTDEVPQKSIIVMEVNPAPIMVTKTSYSVITATMAAAPSTVTSATTSVSVYVQKEINLVTPEAKMVYRTKIEPTVMYSTRTSTKAHVHTKYGVRDISSVVRQLSTETTTSTVRQTHVYTQTVVHTIDNIGERVKPVEFTTTVDSVLYLTTTRTTTESAIDYSTQYSTHVYYHTSTLSSVVSQTVTDTVEVTRPASTVTVNRISNTVRLGCSSAQPGYSYSQPSRPLLLPQ